MPDLVDAVPVDPAPDYVPVDGRTYKLTMGVRPLDLADWIEVDRFRAAEMRAKAGLLASSHADLVAHLPEADAACTEVLDLLLAHVLTRWPQFYRRDGDRITDTTTGLVTDLAALHPIDAAGRLVQEDLCVMVRRDEGWVLGGASLCFPNRWRLSEKLGRTLADIHDPVPTYARRLGVATDRLFDRMTDDTPISRLNWAILDRPDLYQPEHPPHEPGFLPLDPSDVGRLLYFRVERQTVRLLPRSGGTLFTIRTYVRRLDEVVASQADRAADLAATIRTVTPDLLAYRGWSDIVEPLLAWLDDYAATIDP